MRIAPDPFNLDLILANAPCVKRQVSGPILELLRQSSVSADEVDQALEHLVEAKASAVLRTNHPLVVRVRRATGINVTQVSRRSRHLLIEIEQQKDGKPSWQYRERSPRNCTFSCRGQLPATIEVALNGELLEKLVISALAMRDTVIEHVGSSGDGWLNVDVAPAWYPF